jgi:O-antigen biosynthesis protein
MDVSIIIVGHGLTEMTMECITSVINVTKGPEYEIVLVDNGSPKPYQSIVRNQIRSEKNLSHASASSLGESKADPSSDFILLLNNDILINQEDWLTQLVNSICNPMVMAVGPKQVQLDETIFATEIFFNGVIPYHAYMGCPKDIPEVQNEKEVLALNFGCVLIDRWAFKTIGFDPNFVGFGQLQDIDWCLSARRRGYKLRYTPKSEVIHLGHATVNNENTSAQDTLQQNIRIFEDKWIYQDPELFQIRHFD